MSVAPSLHLPTAAPRLLPEEILAPGPLDELRGDVVAGRGRVPETVVGCCGHVGGVHPGDGAYGLGLLLPHVEGHGGSRVRAGGVKRVREGWVRQLVVVGGGAGEGVGELVVGDSVRGADGGAQLVKGVALLWGAARRGEGM